MRAIEPGRRRDGVAARGTQSVHSGRRPTPTGPLGGRFSLRAGRDQGYERAVSSAKKATIVSFQKEQGFGRVAIEGEGELPFDAVVAQPPPEQLLAGTEVMVETGPSRIAGRTKVLKLWIGDAPP